MPRFTIARILICDKHRWLVEGRISVAGKVAAEDYSRLLATKAKAEAAAHRLDRIEAQAEEYIAERNAARRSAPRECRALLGRARRPQGDRPDRDAHLENPAHQPEQPSHPAGLLISAAEQPRRWRDRPLGELAADRPSL